MNTAVSYLKNPALWIGVAIGWLVVPKARAAIGR